jgi:hypothetical protein
VIAFALRVYRLDAQSIWWDEGHSIQMASAPLAQIPTLPGMDVHPPGYFALLHGWMAVAGRSEFALRYLSVLFSLVSVALFVPFARSLAGTRAGRRQGAALAAGALAALSPLYVAYAQEVRMYTLVVLLAAASAYFQWRILQGRQAGRPAGWHTAGYVATTAAALYTHYFTLFLLLFQNLAWLVWVAFLQARGTGRRRSLAVWLGTQAAILALFLPQLPLALRQTAAYANPNLQSPAAAEFVARSWRAYTFGPVGGQAAGQLPPWLLAALAGLAALLSVATLRGRTRAGQAGVLLFLLGWLLLPLAVYFLVLLGRPSFEPRYMMFVTPALLLLWSWGLAGTRIPIMRIERGWRWLGAVGVLVILIMFAWGTWSYFARAESYKDDSAGVAAWLAGEAGPDDLVLVDVPHPFHYYADRIPAPTRYLFVDVHTAADMLNREAAGRQRLFWVTWWGSDTDPRGVIPFLLDKAGRRAGALDFRGYRVTWWQLPGGAHFSLPDELSPQEIAFGDGAKLDGLAFSDTARSGGMAWATLHFTLVQDTLMDYRVSLRLRGPDGNMLPPTDKDLLNDRHFRTSAWPLEDARLNQAVNVYTLPIPGDAPGGEYCLEAVVYEAQSLEPLPVVENVPSDCVSAGADGVSARLGAVSVAR